MPTSRFSTLPILVAAFALLSCQQVPKNLPDSGPDAVVANQLSLARQSLKQSEKSSERGKRLGHVLLAAELAWDLDWKHSGQEITHASEKAESVYNAAILELLQNARDPKEVLSSRQTEYLVRGPRGNYRVQIDPRTFESLEQYPEMKPASECKGKEGFNNRHIRAGFGLPLVAINREAVLRLTLTQGAADQFKRREGYTAPRTALLIFDKPTRPGQSRNVRIAIVDPRKVQEEKVGKRFLPVAADFTAPLMAAYPAFGSQLSALVAAIYPDTLLASSAIYATEVYDPERIPVLLVHGLFSTPDMWKNVINDLGAMPGIGDRFQFYTFTYPTGMSPILTAELLREKLQKVRKVRPLPNGYVLVGHSMGGILSRMQIVDSDNEFWTHTFGERAEQALRKMPENDPIRQAYFFNADPGAKRAIFICTPHQGSPMAERSIVRWFGRLARTPLKLSQTIATSPLRALNLIPDRLPSSAEGLSPSSPVLQTMVKRPMKAPVHSIIGNRGQAGPLEATSDGIVPYPSAHVPEALSEKLVPGNHGAFALEESISEVARILREHDRSAGKPRKQGAR
ncbi:MAG: lipase family alpha/beta hydrolase [Verrucomicrobiales bacterium]